MGDDVGRKRTVQREDVGEKGQDKTRWAISLVGKALA